MKKFIKLKKLKSNEKVAVISPSAGLPEIFPWVLDLGIERLEKEYGLEVVEYSTTRKMNSSLKDRANDIMSAFSDESIKAVFASIGGSDQIKLIKYLDPNVFIKNPKPFFGFSDNTHLHNFLWNLGIPSFYGSNVMNQLAMPKEMFELSKESIRRALFEEGQWILDPAEQFTEIDGDWSDKENLDKAKELEPNSDFIWCGEGEVDGILWGGCVESLIVQCASEKFMPADKDIEGAVLMLETAEDIPDHWVIEYLLTGFGERGWLNKFSAILVGRPKTWSIDKQLSQEQRIQYRRDQAETVERVVREYSPMIPIIQNMDFGHTDPQVAMPLGGRVLISTENKQIPIVY